ncbi:penicillin-binding protein 2 [Trichothermofontia sichuanensis B231]|uniref:peptidoglycan D,D-transpeptidase FtsI family protein n=1 Tax=Trichothermofontia sichuanensis TaxID=3045816 RepID=UPI0022470F86|nr:penicillin-binding protein 2 [Trichothermofontia sichuanensis]UZQ53462.1 penicillin-binding protein 2 [Trichothermofontia sichuanensis B231]
MGLLVNLARLQIIEAKNLQERAQEQQTALVRPVVPRRPITDRNGVVLAVDQPVYLLYAHPQMFTIPPAQVAAQLAPLLARPVQELEEIFAQGGTGIKVALDLPEAIAQQIQRLGLDGIDLEQQQERLYPQQDLFAGIVGYVNADRQGQAGVEFSQQKVLERLAPDLRLRRMGDGTILPIDLPESFLHADTLRLQLTLDSGLQRVARTALQQQMQKFNAKRGTVLVMDARDGSLLALVSEPSFDPNRYYEAKMELLKNWALTDLYEPGSTFKPINVAIALEAGAVEPQTVLPDEGEIYVDGWPIRNNDGVSYGAVSVTEAVKYSSNIGMVHMVERMEPNVYYDWLERIGLGKPVGIDLPFEAEGQVRSREEFVGAKINRATTSFGQGFSLTPLQLLRLHGMLASGGLMITPHVVQGLIDENGKAQWQPTLPDPKRIFSPKTAQAVVEMMEQVVKDGTGKPAQIPGYRIAGKTGTAQKASPYGGYSNAVITSFVGILPVEAPRYVVLAVVDEPTGGLVFGSTVAAPIVKTVMEALIVTEGIPPTSSR